MSKNKAILDWGARRTGFTPGGAYTQPRRPNWTPLANPNWVLSKQSASVRDLVTAALSLSFKEKWSVPCVNYALRVAIRYDCSHIRGTALIKLACHDLRMYGLTGSKITTGFFLIPPCLRWQAKSRSDFHLVALQLSMLGRALPPLFDQTLIDKSVQKLKDAMEEPPPAMTQAFRNNFYSVLTRRTLRGFKADPTSGVPMSPGSCLESPRKDGGFSGFIYSHQRAVNRQREEGSIVNLPLSGTVPKEVDLISRVHVVCEQGGKFRPVTISDGRTLFHGHQFRRSNFGVLYRQRGTSFPLTSKEMKFKVPRDQRQRFVYSADLTDATNLMSWEAISIVCMALKLDPRLVKSHKCYYEHPDKTKDPIEPKRGSFMGLPPSWIVLSLIHETICLIVDPLGNFFLKGDDLIALWTEDQWSEYVRLMELAGFKINKSKSFKSKPGRKCYGWFCEKPYLLVPVERGEKNLLYVLRLEPSVISLRFLSKDTTDSRSGTPYWVSACRRYAEVAHVIRRGSKVLRSIVRKKIPLALQLASFDHELPIELGGLSLVKTFGRKLRPVSLHAYRSVHNGTRSPLHPVDFSLRSELSDLVSDRYGLIVRPPMIHWKAEGRRVIDPKSVGPVLGTASGDYLMQGLANPAPYKKAGPKFKSIYSKFWKGLHSVTTGGSLGATYGDSYRLCRNLGIDLGKLLEGPYFRGKGRLSAIPVMEAPLQTSYFDDGDT